MDKVYEKKLMELFMDLFEDRNSQYIVVTPKVSINLLSTNTSRFLYLEKKRSWYSQQLIYRMPVLVFFALFLE